MSSWNDLVVQALEKLGAAEVMVPGAKLRQQMELLGRDCGVDIAGHLSERGRSFSELIDEVEGVSIRRRPGSDMLVGLAGSAPPTTEAPVSNAQRLRKDVWEAFTKLSSDKYVYQTDADRFTLLGETIGPSIPVPDVTLDLHMQDRQEFLETLPGDAGESMVLTLQRSSKPLAEFRVALEENGYLQDWLKFQGDRIVSRVLDWAKEKSIEPRQAWFPPRGSQITPQQTLEQLLPYMTNEEVHDFKIPLRAVQAMLAGRKQR